MELPSVTVITPCLNEAGYVDRFLESLIAQRRDTFSAFEVIIADGGSNDGTRAKLDFAAQRYRWLQVVANPDRIVSTGLNAAIRAASGETIVRMDMHTEYAPDYLERSVLKLVETGAANVGGAWRARGITRMGRAIAAAFQSPLGCGGAKGHDLNHEGPVDNCYLGCWMKKTLMDAGLFDEGLVRNQDDELNLRLTRAGGVVWQSRAIVSWYTPRTSLRSLFRQYYQYGFWKIPVIRKHKLPASIRHLVPGMFVLAGFSLLPLSLLMGIQGFSVIAVLLRGLWLAMVATYMAVLLLESVRTSSRGEWDVFPLLPAVFATYHVAYGLGFLCGLLYWPSRPLGITPQNRVFSGLTR